MPRFVARIVLVLAALILLRGIYSEIRTWKGYEEESDFPVYYTAAWLVRTDLNVHLYDEAELNIDPIHGDADPGSVFFQTAHAHGIPDVSRYIYPPTLADLMVPLTFLPHRAALIAWHILNLAMVAATAILLARMLGLLLPGQIALVGALLFLFRPTLCCFYYGQAPVLLLFLSIAGFHFYRRGSPRWAGFFFALAIAIKLTPLVVVLPFLAWRQWKMLRAIALWCLVLLAALWAVNGTAALALYAGHVVPSMMYRNIDMTNINLGTALQVFWYGSDRGSPIAGLVLLSKILSVLVLAAAAWLSRSRRAESLSLDHQLTILAVFLMISCCISPVSWLHAYTLSAPAMLIAFLRVHRGQSSLPESFLALWFLFVNASTKLINWAWTTHRTPLYDLAIFTPIVGILLGFVLLARLRAQHSAARERTPQTASATA